MKPVTWRFAAAEPNLQNIPIRTMEGSRIRKLFGDFKEVDILAHPLWAFNRFRDKP